MSDKSEQQITNPLLEITNKNLEDNIEKKVDLTDEEKFNLMKEIEIKTEKKWLNYTKLDN